VNHPGCDLSITVTIDKSSDHMQVVKILRGYLRTPVALLLKSIKKAEPVYIVTLKVTMFYEGWKEFYQVVSALRNGEIKFTIEVNKEVMPEHYADELNDLMMNIRKEDIY